MRNIDHLLMSHSVQLRTRQRCRASAKMSRIRPVTSSIRQRMLRALSTRWQRMQSAAAGVYEAERE